MSYRAAAGVAAGNPAVWPGAATTGPESVVLGAAGQQVVFGAAVQRIGPMPADQGVVPGRARQRIHATHAFKHIIARQTGQCVVATVRAIPRSWPGPC